MSSAGHVIDSIKTLERNRKLKRSNRSKFGVFKIGKAISSNGAEFIMTPVLELVFSKAEKRKKFKVKLYFLTLIIASIISLYYVYLEMT